MSSVRSSFVRVGWMLATALSVGMLPASSRAYTPEQQQACTGDAFRLCNAEIPDVDRVTACMIRNKSRLSPGCRVLFRPEQVATPVTARRPVHARPHKTKRGAKPTAT
jgi:hypothetical protein